ncbi:hypothetical protein ABW21_db0206630 [Orbilia brochopaga]|nr:hypothetical protein ABW21_db0206630 [Drechslerella brochopaga]
MSSSHLRPYKFDPDGDATARSGRMFSFLRTSRQLWRRRLSLNPNLLFYRVKIRSAINARRWGLPVAALGIAGGVVWFNRELVDRVVTNEPWYIPIWFMHETKPVPYAQGGPEHQEFKELMTDVNRRVTAEDAVLQAIKKRVSNSNVNIGTWEGFSSPYWMTFQLAAPPIGQARRYLAFSLRSIDLVTRPIHPGNVLRLNVAFRPRATAVSLQAFSTSLLTSFQSMLKPDQPIGGFKPPAISRPPSTSRPAPGSQSGSDSDSQENLEVPLLPSGVVMALHDAASDAHRTLQRELARDYMHNIPPPPRGWIIADGTVRLVGSDLALIVDFRVAFDPKNLNKLLVYELKARHHQRRRGLRVSTFQKPSVPAPLPPPKEPQEMLPKPTVQPPASPGPPDHEQQQETQRKQ